MNFNSSSGNSLAPKETENRLFVVIILIYVVLFSSLLLSTSGMPYVLDNNESYSSLIHAKSLNDHGVAQSKGLADEALGDSPEAHPYVHSHQGNFPRIFAWIIYKLGATTASSQIVVTTFTIGLGAILFAFAFFSRIANPWFALLCCLVFLTDYVFFLQWQVVTYRVWYAFVFFLQFLCIERWLDTKHRHWIITLAANTTLFCYGELIFAAFLGLSSVFWLVLRGQKNMRTALWGLMSLATGLAVALVVLSAQGVAYLGAENFLKDLQLTFGARNNFDSARLSMVEVGNFYRNSRVIFWENFSGRDEFLGPLPFIRSIVQSFIQAGSPLVFVVFVILFVFSTAIKNRNCLCRAEDLSNSAGLRNNRSLLLLSGHYVVAGSFVLVLIMAGQSIARNYYSLTLSSGGIIFLAFELVLLSWVMMRFEWGGIKLSFLLSLTSVLLAIGLPFIISNQYSNFWLDAHGKFVGESLPWVLPLITTALIHGYAKSPPEAGPDIKSVRDERGLAHVVHFLLTGFFAYAIAYHLSPGYVYTGYIDRYAPFLVYFADVGIAVALSTPVMLAYFFARKCVAGEWTRFTVGSTVLVNAVVLFVLWLWLGIQYSHMNRLPFNHFDILQRLDSSPFKGASFVVSTYAAPVGVQTGQWAYLDPDIGRAMFVDVHGEKRLKGDRRYLWFADKNHNPDYRRPDYFICMLGQNLRTAMAHALSAAGSSGCLNYPLVKLAMDSRKPVPGLSLVEYDEGGPERVGFVSWAIVKFDWDNGLGGGLVWEGDPGVPASIFEVAQ